MQWLILYSHMNDDVLNEWQLLRWKQKRWNSSRPNWKKYIKWIVSAQNELRTLFGTKYSRVDEVKFVENLILVHSWILCPIYNEAVDIDEKRQRNIVGGIFINYGELHDNYQHS